MENATGGWHTLHFSVQPTLTGSFDLNLSTGFAEAIAYQFRFGHFELPVGTEGRDDRIVGGAGNNVMDGGNANVAINSEWFIILRDFDSGLLDNSDFAWA